MMCKAHRLIAAVLGAACLLSLSACSGQEGPEGESSSPAGQSNASTTGGTEGPGTQPPVTNDVNPLTGVADITPGASVRPIALMVENSSTARPQLGLDEADVFLEAETEGGITRIMAVFAGASRVPDEIGPLRSARSPFVTVAQSLDAVYCHAGGSTLGLANIQKFGLDDVNFLSNASQAGWRDPELSSQRGTEHSLLSGGQKLLLAFGSVYAMGTPPLPTTPPPSSLIRPRRGTAWGTRCSSPSPACSGSASCMTRPPSCITNTTAPWIRWSPM